jgi:predicted dinucleotide-binding enzyme
VSGKLGILGGTGGMGSLFARVYEAAGWEVSVRGRTGREPLPAFLARQDVVMVSVPIDVTLGVIAAVAPHLRPDQLLCDLTPRIAGSARETRFRRERRAGAPARVRTSAALPVGEYRTAARSRAPRLRRPKRGGGRD